MRRLRTKAIKPVAAKPSKADAKYDDKLTYDEKVLETLRDVYEKCSEARKTFILDVDKAATKAKQEEEEQKAKVKAKKKKEEKAKSRKEK